VKIDEEHVRVFNAASQLEFTYDMKHTEISGSTVDSATFIYPIRVATPERERSMSADRL
jgi:hypothetical protein